MDIFSFVNADIFSWVILPVLIFTSRIFDVSIGTMRIIFVSRGKKYIAPILGFFEVLIWLIAISQIMQHLDNVFCYLGYACGYATGTFIGMKIEEKLAIGIQVVRVILINDECELRDSLSSAGFGVTIVDARGVNGDVKIIYTIVRRKDIDSVIAIIDRCQPKAFYSIEDAKTAKDGVFPVNKTRGLFDIIGK